MSFFLRHHGSEEELKAKQRFATGKVQLLVIGNPICGRKLPAPPSPGLRVSLWFGLVWRCSLRPMIAVCSEGSRSLQLVGSGVGHNGGVQSRISEVNLIVLNILIALILESSAAVREERRTATCRENQTLCNSQSLGL